MNWMKKNGAFRLWLALIVLVLSVGLILWASWPASRQIQQLPLPTIQILLPTPTVLLNTTGWI